MKKCLVSPPASPATSEAPVVEVECDHGEAGGQGHQGDGHPVVQTWGGTLSVDIQLASFSSPISGSFSEVGGMLSPITIRNTVMDSRVVIPRVTWD